MDIKLKYDAEATKTADDLPIGTWGLFGVDKSYSETFVGVIVNTECVSIESASKGILSVDVSEVYTDLYNYPVIRTFDVSISEK